MNNLDHDLKGLDFDSLFQRAGKEKKYSQEEVNKAKDNLRVLREQNFKNIFALSLELDKHIIWISGGAILFGCNLLLSENSLHYLVFLSLSLFLFLISLLSTIGSYKHSLNSGFCLSNAQNASEDVGKELENYKDDFDSLKKNINTHFRDMKKFIKDGQSHDWYVLQLNLLTFWSFFFAVTCFFLFGLFNIDLSKLW